MTALFLAARRGLTENVKALLTADGIQVNEKDAGGLTALHLAARNGDTRIVKALLAADGIHINEKDADGWPALDLAIKYCRYECEELLLEKG